MRLCFYNPHAVVNVMGETFLSRLAQIFGTNKKPLKKHNRKYEFLLKILNDKSYNTAIVVDGGGTSLSTILNKIPWLRDRYGIYKLISFTEIYVWCFLNGINPFKQKIIFNKNKLDQHHDVLFSFAFCTEIFLNDRLIEKSIIKSFKGEKILHATHFFKLTKKVAENVGKTGTTHMVAEADLKKSPYFNKFFYFIKDVYILPHVLRERYKKNTDFKERKNICLALGTLVIESELDKANDDYFSFFKIDTLHPMRKIIFENKENLSNLIDSLIYFHNEKRLAIINKSKLYKKNNIFKIVYDLFFLSEGKKYHSVDIVEKYNKYKMFIAPEENIGLPSVNVVEGMVCGCAFIGLDHAMYTDSGMVGGQNYIAYDGTLEDLKNKISYYQNHENELEKIAANGYEFAKKIFAEEKVIKDFWGYLERLTI
jgi:glycosyltransferase involved in cell wall biosynthesis